MKKRTKIAVRVSIVATVLIGAIISSLASTTRPATAATSDDEIMKKALAMAMLTCYRSPSANFVTPWDTNQQFSVEAAVKPNGTFYMPTNIGNTLSNEPINCQEVFLGATKGSWPNEKKSPGILKLFGKDSTNLTPSNLGYVAGGSTAGATERKCVYFKYHIYDGDSDEVGNPGNYDGDQYSNKVCFPIKDGKIDVSIYGNILQEPANNTNWGGLQIYYDSNFSCLARTIYKGTPNETFLLSGYDPCIIARINGMTFDDLVSELSKPIVAGYKIGPDGPANGINYPLYGNPESDYPKVISSDSGSSLTQTMVIDDSSAVSAINWIANKDNGYTNFGINDNDWAYIYNTYIDQLKDSGDIAIDKSCNASKSDPNVITMDNGATWCKVDRAENVTELFAGQSGNSDKWLKLMSFTEILEKMKKLDYNKVDPGTIGGTQTPTPGTTADNTDTIAACYNGAGVLGWIICPVAEAVGGATGWIYEYIIEPALQIPANDYFGQNGNDSLYGAWSTFRNFANILFVIAFIVVILAQVTGIGVSNYNIKKILPRLIMVVVLVNVSFIICQLAVDVSNIVGSTIESTLGNIKINGAEPEHFGSVVNAVLNGLGLAIISGVGVVTALSSSVAAATLSYLIIPIVLTFIGCLIAIIFFFIVLAARQAGVVILIILSPLAVVCYALPNTKSLFDRWRKLFTAVIFVYPICGLLMGGGKFVSALMLTMAASGDTLGAFYTIAALLVSVMPFFLVPSLLRGSMAAAGNIGARLASAGTNLSNRLNSGIRNSEAYKMHQQEEARRLGIRRNQTRVGRLSATGKGGGLVGRFRRATGMNDHLSNRQQALLGQAQLGIDKATGDTANAMRLGWENDGSANNIGEFDDDGNIVGGENSMLQRYMTATKELEKDPNDYGALERQRAAASVLASTAPGRSALFEANDRLGQEIGGMSGRAQTTARQVMQRTFNNLRRSNASDLAKSPLLDEQAKQYQVISGAYNYDEMSKEIMKGSIQGLNTRDMSQMNHRDLSRYLSAIQDGRIQYGSDEYRTITSLASKTLADPHNKGNLGEKETRALNNIANTRYNPPSTNGADADTVRRNVTDALGGASDDEMARLRNYLQDDTVDATEKAQLLDNLSDTLGRSLSESGDSGVAAEDVSFKVSQGRAQQIGQMLAENGRNIGDAAANYGGVGKVQTEDRFDLATGVRIDHSKHRTLADRHPTWVRAAGSRPGHYQRGDWVERVGSTYRKLNAGQAHEADMLEQDDIRDKQMRDDEEIAAKQRWHRP